MLTYDKIQGFFQWLEAKYAIIFRDQYADKLKEN